MFVPKTCGFTGHRPQAFLGKLINTLNDIPIKFFEEIRKMLLDMYHNHDCRKFITGGAVGFDQWVALVLIELKKEFPDIVTVMAKPFPSQDCKWPPQVREEFKQLCSQIDEIVEVSPDPYHPSKMHIRNQWMVDHSDIYIACIYPETKWGGTYSCLQYAIKKKLPIYILDPGTGKYYAYESS